MKRKIASGLGLALFTIILITVFVQRQLIRDYYVVHTTQLTAEAGQLEAKLALTKPAKFIYAASRPQVQTAADFNNSCKSVSHEHSIVLGCYTAQQIYIFNVEDSRLDGVKEVTAAHELLHAVYERMSNAEKMELDKQLLSTAESIDEQRFKDTISEYKRTEPDQIANELHSILGTEIAVLPTSLENHYKKYFNNRAQIVAYAKQYEGSFTSLENQIKDYDKELESLRSEKESLESSLTAQQQTIEDERSELDSLLENGDRQGYNNLVPVYNARIQQYNTTVNQLKQVVTTFNEIVQKRNVLAATQNDLVKRLDSSSYDPIE